MTQTPDLFALMRLTVADPITGGRAVMALNPPTSFRWMLLAAAILVAVVLFYAVPVLSGQSAQLPSPWSFTLGQGSLNVLVVCLVAYVGRAFGGTGSFNDALLLMAWVQMVTVALLVMQLVALFVFPPLSAIITALSIIISLWMLTGFVCALHGFRSRGLVLVGGIMVFTITAFVLSLVLLLLGFDYSGVTDV